MIGYCNLEELSKLLRENEQENDCRWDIVPECDVYNSGALDLTEDELIAWLMNKSGLSLTDNIYIIDNNEDQTNFEETCTGKTESEIDSLLDGFKRVITNYNDIGDYQGLYRGEFLRIGLISPWADESYAIIERPIRYIDEDEDEEDKMKD